MVCVFLNPSHEYFSMYTGLSVNHCPYLHRENKRNYVKGFVQLKNPQLIGRWQQSIRVMTDFLKSHYLLN